MRSSAGLDDNSDSETEVIRRYRRLSLPQELVSSPLDEELAVLLMKDVARRVHKELQAVEKVAFCSKWLKGSFVRALRDATYNVRVILKTLNGRLRDNPRYCSASASSRLYLENQELRAKTQKLWTEMESSRAKARMPPPLPPSLRELVFLRTFLER